MKKFILALCLVFLLCSAFVYADQVKVNIVYPINGAVYPICDPMCEVKSAYITASFGTTYRGGMHKAQWGFDNTAVGSASYYDQYSAQFVHKLPAGKHTFWVKTDYASNQVVFTIGK